MRAFPDGCIPRKMKRMVSLILLNIFRKNLIVDRDFSEMFCSTKGFINMEQVTITRILDKVSISAMMYER